MTSKKNRQHNGQKTKDKQPSRSRNRRYQRGNQNPYIEEEQTTQWPNEKVQMEKQHTCKTKDRVTRTPQKPRVNSGAPEG